MIGRLILSGDRNKILNIIRSGPTQIVVMDEETPSQDVICGSILLPPFSIMNELVDGRLDMHIIEDQYFEYLHTTEPISFVCGLMALMLKGVNVVISTEKYDYEFSVIPKTIWDFFNIRYGIMPETYYSGFRFADKPMHLDTIYSDLFLHDYIDDIVLKAKHSSHPYNQDVQIKLMNLYNLRALNNKSNGPIDPFVNMRG